MKVKTIFTILIVLAIAIAGIVLLGKNRKAQAPQEGTPIVGEVFRGPNGAPSVKGPDSAPPGEDENILRQAQDITGEVKEVKYSSDGFSPATITIKAGTTVIFENKSGANIWVASDPHPLHTIYPEFDSKAPVADDNTFSFKFLKKGTWGYHNHLSSTHKGMVVVE